MICRNDTKTVVSGAAATAFAFCLLVSIGSPRINRDVSDIRLVGIDYRQSQPGIIIVEREGISQQELFEEGQVLWSQYFLNRVFRSSIELIDLKGEAIRLRLDGGKPETHFALSSQDASRFNQFSMPDVAINHKEYLSLISSGVGIVGASEYREALRADGTVYGVSFYGVDPQSFFGRAGIKSGDIITAINGSDIVSVDSFVTALTDASEFRAVVYFERDGVEGSVAVRQQMTPSPGA